MNQTCRHTYVAIEYFHPWQRLAGTAGQAGAIRMEPDRALIETDISILHISQKTHFPRTECIHMGRIGLRRITGTTDLAIHGDEDAVTASIAAASQAHGIQQIQGAVGTDRCSRPHGPNEDNGLLRVYCQVEEIRRFFQRIRPVGYDNAIHIRRIAKLLHPFGQSQPQCFRHI